MSRFKSPAETKPIHRPCRSERRWSWARIRRIPGFRPGREGSALPVESNRRHPDRRAGSSHAWSNPTRSSAGRNDLHTAVSLRFNGDLSTKHGVQWGDETMPPCWRYEIWLQRVSQNNEIWTFPRVFQLVCNSASNTYGSYDDTLR